jgi:hypothetical protein
MPDGLVPAGKDAVPLSGLLFPSGRGISAARLQVIGGMPLPTGTPHRIEALPHNLTGRLRRNPGS